MDTQNRLSEGRIIFKSKAIFTVEMSDQNFLCQPSSRLQQELTLQRNWLAIGDRVLISLLNSSRWQIEQLLPRNNLVSRRAVTGKDDGAPAEQVIAANVDQLVTVMAAAQPALKWGLLDRYLALAESLQLGVLICITKQDLLLQTNDELQTELFERFVLYRQLGYRLLLCSALNGSGMESIRTELLGRTSLMLGKSGAGKTSLLNFLLPAAEKKVGKVNQVTGNGRHTTTAFSWHSLDEQSAVIDCPGTREFGLWQIAPQDLAECFREMKPYLGKCKFRLDCTHDEEPGCAVRQAVMSGKIDLYRYQSYLKLKKEG